MGDGDRHPHRSICAEPLRLLEGLADESPGDTPIPTLRELAGRWGLSYSAVYRAASALVAAGRLRRRGKRLWTNPQGTPVRSVPAIWLVHWRGFDLTGFCEAARLRGAAIETVAIGYQHELLRALRRGVPRSCRVVAIWAGVEDEERAAAIRASLPHCAATVIIGNHIQGMDSVLVTNEARVDRALAYLAELGHRRIAFWGSDEHPNLSEAFELAAGRLRIETLRVILKSKRLEDLNRQAWGLLGRDPRPTAIVCAISGQAAVLASRAKALRVRIPQSLAILCLRDAPELAHVSPPVTAVRMHHADLGRLAVALLFERMEAEAEGWSQSPARRVSIEPVLEERASCARAGGVDPTPLAWVSARGPRRRAWPADAAERRAIVSRSWLPREGEAPVPYRCVPLPLESFVNRGFTSRGGWLGDLPLAHFAPGLRMIHSVPFRVIDSKRNGGRAAIVLRSAAARSADGLDLPLRMDIPVGMAVERLYFLYSCGWATEHREFGEIRIRMEDETAHRIPLLPFAFGPDDETVLPQWTKESTIQDWFLEFPQFESEDVRHVIVTENGDPFDYERYLYTYRWSNPAPGRVAQIEIEVQPGTETTLGLLAITALEATH